MRRLLTVKRLKIATFSNRMARSGLIEVLGGCFVARLLFLSKFRLFYRYIELVLHLRVKKSFEQSLNGKTTTV
ncbi:MAG: hypothetical protein NZ534_10875, partial [Bacteroidia bacterium]|nr:hypothetical protein [Bacteroidia bacterium]